MKLNLAYDIYGRADIPYTCNQAKRKHWYSMNQATQLRGSRFAAWILTILWISKALEGPITSNQTDLI